MKRYGAKKGKAVFYAKANKYGRGKSNAAKANSIYSKGRTLKKRRTRRRKR